MQKTEHITCTCGREHDVASKDNILHCPICGSICCDECTHVCEGTEHNDKGCEHCMIYDKDLDKWFCCQDCRWSVIDPFGFLDKANLDKMKMAETVLTVCKMLNDIGSKPTTDVEKVFEAASMLTAAAKLYLL